MRQKVDYMNFGRSKSFRVVLNMNSEAGNFPAFCYILIDVDNESSLGVWMGGYLNTHLELL